MTGRRERSAPRRHAPARLAVLGAGLLFASCGGGPATPPPPPPGAIGPGQVLGNASISGRAVLVVPPPPRQKINLTVAACTHASTEPPLSEAVVANPDGSLRNVIVYVKSGLGDRAFAPPGPAVMDQKGCIYVPHVLSVQTNQIVTFVNSDPTLHNVHALTQVNPAFNVGMSLQGQKVSRFFSKPEIVRMKCDVHSWMTSYIGVFDHPFHVVTGANGAFNLEGLPAGSYEIEAWHETYGTKSRSLTLADGEKKTLELTFGG